MYDSLEELLKSSRFQSVTIIIGFALVFLLLFQAGMYVGYRKAAFSYNMGDNYYRAFRGHGPTPFHMPIRGDFVGSDGTVGKVVSVHLPMIVLTSRDNTERAAIVDDKTIVLQGSETTTPGTIQPDDFIVILGSPNEDSQVQAKLIRIVPPPPGEERATTK